MIGTAIFDVVIGLLLLIDFGTWLVAAIAAVHLVIVLTVSGITSITVRDIGLLTAAIALFRDDVPKALLNRFKTTPSGVKD